MRTKLRKIRDLILLLIPMALFIVLIILGRDFLLGNRPAKDSAEGIVRSFARENNIPFDAYPESLIQLLERNPETKDFVLQYPFYYGEDASVDLSQYADMATVPLFLQWDKQWGYIPYGDNVAGISGCGPVCLSMAAYYLTGNSNYSPDRMIDFALKNGYYEQGIGSSWTLISEGAVELGFDVTEIPLDKGRIIRNLEVDNPIICVMGPGDFTTTGHFIVMTGYTDGMIKVNDPNSIENSKKLWDYDAIKDQIKNLWVIRNG